ncbi:conserved hypothetical protein [Histoplasma capsulatum var. duboisii H88]|uniref:Methyltransferase domain-containing protein n=1 Tax=Ajellomyces capsulatus (strain H88) TaxID=544711 RepID=F0USY9_AJEC8|nr:conserved hypothetical protein [Histoplasma capsulatum var. duboisii H88]
MPSDHSPSPNVARTPGTLAAANEKFFSNSAKYIFKEPWVLDFHAKLRAYLEKNIDWLDIANDHAQSTKVAERKMLDYACGDGFLTKIYQPFFTKYVGIDIAPGMVKKYNETALHLGLSQEKMYAVKGDLSSGSTQEFSKPEDVPTADLSREEFFNFDFAGVALALHHMENPEAAIVNLVKRLKNDGVLLAIDLLQPDEPSEPKCGERKGCNHYHHHRCHDDSHGHSHDHTDAATTSSSPRSGGDTISHDHPTFSLERMKSMFARAGLIDVDIILSDWKLELPIVKDPNTKLLFARGRKPQV